jgi:hypothetical protein
MARAAGTKEEPRRLTPRANTLRELYLLSGNRCAMSGCLNVIVDEKGAIIGQVCHIEAAMPDGARFNDLQTNEERRHLSNLVLICANHHLQIDSKQHEDEWTLEKVRKLKADHEAKFKAIPGSLEQRFKSQFADATDELNPIKPRTYKAYEAAFPHMAGMTHKEREKRDKQVSAYVGKMAKVPHDVRDFMLIVIKRSIKLGRHDSGASVHVDDVNGGLGVPHSKIKQFGDSLKRHDVGDVDLVGMGYEDEMHVSIYNPSSHVDWIELNEFASKKGYSLDDFVIHLQFGLLDD